MFHLFCLLLGVLAMVAFAVKYINRPKHCKICQRERVKQKTKEQVIRRDDDSESDLSEEENEEELQKAKGD